MARTLTKLELADALGIAPSRINNWCRDGCPRDRMKPPQPNRFDPDEVKRWLSERPKRGVQTLGKNGVHAPTPPPDGDGTDYKRLTDKERHRKLLLANDETTGKLIRKTDVVTAWTASLERVRSEFSIKGFSMELIDKLESGGAVKLIDAQKAQAILSAVELSIHETLHKPDYAKAKRERLRKVTA